MSNFVYSTQITFDGPWLIDREALLHLGKTIEAISAKFASANKELVDSKLNLILERYPREESDKKREELLEEMNQEYAMKRKVTLSCSSSKYVEDESIEQLLSLPEMLDESPTDIEVEIKTRQRSAQIKLGNRLFGGSKLSISTSPETDELAREAFVELQQWAVANQVPLWQRFWANNYGTIVWLWFCALVVIATLFIPSKSDYIEKEVRPDVIQILKNGISIDEMPGAIELLLRNEFKVPKTEAQQPLPFWFKIYFFGGLVACLVLYFRPSLVIGIGRNEQRIKRWRWWAKFVGISLPGLIFTAFILPYLSVLLGFH